MSDAETPPGPPPPGLPATAPGRPLRRGVSDRKLAGVCSGVARWLDIDPLVPRVTVAALSIFGGTGVLLYGLGWLLVPEEGTDSSEGQRLLHGQVSASAVTGIVVVIVGLSVFGGVLGGGLDLSGLLLLAVLGVAVVAAARGGRVPGVPGADWVGGVPSSPPPPTGAGAPVYSTPVPPGGGQSRADPYGRRPGTAYAPPRPPTPPPGGPPVDQPAPRPPRERSVLGLLTVSVAVLVTGALLAWGLWTGSGMHARAVVAIALAVVGAGLVVSTLAGRARWLIPLGIALSLVLVVAASYDLPVRGGVGERVWAPRSDAEVDSPYRLGVGEARLDLGAVDPVGTLDVNASLGVGHLIVLVPADVDLTVRAEAGVGEVDLPDGPPTTGFGAERRWTDPAVGTSAGEMVLDLRVGMGEVEVRRAAS